MSEPKPTVGRIVHYVFHGVSGKECQAAIVTKVDGSYEAALTAFTPFPIVLGDCMADFTENQGGTWHWPERV